MTDNIMAVKKTPQTSHWAWGILALAAICFGAGRTSLFLSNVSGSVVQVWSAAGVAVAALLIWGVRLWPGIFLGTFFLCVTKAIPWPASLGIAVGDTLQGLLAAWLVQRFAAGVKAFDRTGTVFKFITLGALVSPMVSATFGVMSLCTTHSANWERSGIIWLNWWLGEAARILVVTPLLVIWKTYGLPRWTLRQILEGATMLVAITVITLTVFPEHPTTTLEDLEWLVIPPIIWTAIRFGPPGAATAVCLTAFLAVASILHGFGPFQTHAAGQSLFWLRVFLGTVSTTALVLAAAMAERRAAEETAGESEKQLRTITDITPVLLSRCSRDLRYVFVNRAYAELLGRTPEEVAGKPIVEIMGAACYEKIRPYVEKVLQGRAVEYEVEVPFEGVGPRFLRGAYEPERDEEGNVRGWVASITDISERKRAEEALREAQRKLQQHAAHLEKTVAERTAKLQETVGELEAFSYSLSHDMRAPLRGIQGFTRMVLQDHAQNLGPKGADLLQKVVNASGRMDRLIVSVLAFTRLAHEELELTEVNLEKLVREIIEQCPELQSPHAVIAIQSPLLPVLADDASLTQCISNLLGNAVKFVPRGVQPQITIYSKPVGENVRLWIQDNGIGIEAGQQQKIFQVFHRLHGEGAYAGTGIGLAIVRKAAERMGGEAGVESTPGKGSRFWVQLPRPNRVTGRSADFPVQCRKDLQPS